MDRTKRLRSDPKSVPIILNDRQIYRVTITKSVPPKQSLGLGHFAVW